jgi:HD-GYP domain-containing protein (c-di-GMP phosphodiesterase class II)/DNA-binding CsgD family transcriptional regulator
VGSPPSASPVRLAELVSALSLGIDLGFGQPMEHVLRQCLIATRLAERIGLGERERASVYYTALLVNVGCHTDAHEQAKWFGDDIALKLTKYQYEPRSFREAVAMIRRFGAGRTPVDRVRTGVDFALHGRHDAERMIARHAQLAQNLAGELGLSDSVCDALGAAYEQWDGKGWPGTLGGENVPIASRIAQLAEYVEVAQRVNGISGALAVTKRSQFDPALVGVLRANRGEIFHDLDRVDTWTAVIEAEPALAVVLPDEHYDAALLAIANYVDLKSPFTLGHSRAVADLAATAGGNLGLDGSEARALRRAGLVHGFGKLGVSNGIWDKPGPLAAGEWERVRLQPYLTGRMFQQSKSLAPLGSLAAQHRERLDGSGYPGGLTASAISLPARVLAAADAYQSMREPRPYRPALSADAAAAELRAEVEDGRLDADAVTAVLTAAGHHIDRRRAGPAGLTGREVDVLRLLALGLSSKEIAARLVISPKTARNHIEHVYTKTGATSRVTASLFAIQQGLLPDFNVNGHR